jgi:ankyrin repeat protein
MNAQTHLFQAVFRSKPLVTRLLLERGSGINKVDNSGSSPIFYAAYAGFAEGVDLLLRAGANLGTATDRLGNTPLHDLAGADKYLTKRFASPKIAEEHGEFFLSWMPAKGATEFKSAKDYYLRTASLMLAGAPANGLDPHARNHAGESAADLAENAGFEALRQLLQNWTPSTGSEVQEIREKIKQLYMQFSPEKLHKVDLLMQKYKGQEQELLDTVRQKYVVIDKDDL